MNKIYFIFLIFFVTFSKTENILFYFARGTYSHRISIWPLIEKLADDGHKITFLSCFHPKTPTTHPNITEFVQKDVVNYMNSLIEKGGADMIKMRIDGEQNKHWGITIERAIEIGRIVYESQEFLYWLENSHFDLVFVGGGLNEHGFGVAYKFKAPSIIFDTSQILQWQYDTFGIPAETSTIPDLQIGYPQQMSFFEKVSNTLRPIGWYFLRKFFIFPKLENYMKKVIPDLPSLIELESSASLIFVTSHPSFDFSRSLPPLVIPIAGLHLYSKSKQELTQEMANFADEAKDGFVFISFGSFTSTNMDQNLKNIFFKTMRKFENIKFLMKWEIEHTIDFPVNLVVTNWAPQQALLAHKKIKCFITHGGLTSILESIQNAVKLIVFPLFGEQDYNAERVAYHGYGINLEIATLTEDIFETALNNILYDESYTKKVNLVSKLFKDRPENPLETAIWWTNFILRNKNNTEHLKPLSQNQFWFQRRLLDVWLFIFISLFLGLITSSYILVKIATILKKLFKVKNVQKIKKKKRN